MEYTKKSLLSMFYIYLLFNMHGTHTSEIIPVSTKSLHLNLKSFSNIKQIPLGCNIGEYIQYKYPGITPPFLPQLCSFATICYSDHAIEKKIIDSLINTFYYLITIYPDFKKVLAKEHPKLNTFFNAAYNNIGLIRTGSTAYSIYRNYDTIKDIVQHYPQYIKNTPFTVTTPLSIICAWNFLGYVTSIATQPFNTKPKEDTEDDDDKIKTKEPKNGQLIYKNILEHVLPTAGSLYTAYLAHLGHRDTQKTLWFLILTGVNIGMKTITSEDAVAGLAYIFIKIFSTPPYIC